MIINSQAFNARGKDARRISMKLDEFRSRRPIDIIAKTNPILIIDEPQSVEGKQTKENLKQFNPLLTLRYSATHKSDSIYNMVYRLDAMEAYNKRLVKKIAVKGVSESGSTATESYVYLESINLSKAAPTATIQFDYKGANGIRKITRTVSEGYNLYDNSGSMEEYKQSFVVSRIDGRDDSVEFLNGIKIYAGDVIGKVSEDQLRRIQIRETILSHIQRERELFYKGIKVLSLFFIDEVAKYRVYDEAGQAADGIYAQMFMEEYNDIIGNIEFKNIVFSYNNESDNVLNNVSFKIKNKEKNAIIGMSGCGKTTIFKLLLKQYDNYYGNILIDNHNIKDFSESCLRNTITIVNQEPMLFNMTIKNNLLMVNENATDEEIRRACKLANIDDFINTLPNKYDEIIEENTTNLSIGQKQRIAIARAILKNTPIILFDEITSALDKNSKRIIEKTINKLSEEKTIIVIAHTLDSIEDYDNIIVLKDGKITEQGSHSELMENKGLYFKMINL